MDCLLNFLVPDMVNKIAKDVHGLHIDDVHRQMRQDLADAHTCTPEVPESIVINGMICWYSVQDTDSNGCGNLCVFNRDLRTGVRGYRAIEADDEFEPINIDPVTETDDNYKPNYDDYEPNYEGLDDFNTENEPENDGWVSNYTYN
jgi:hypothetical protein